MTVLFRRHPNVLRPDGVAAGALMGRAKRTPAPQECIPQTDEDARSAGRTVNLAHDPLGPFRPRRNHSLGSRSTAWQ